MKPMDSFISLKTWGGQSSFSYSKSDLLGITIKFGDGFTAKITMEEYVALIQHFQGQTVNIGTSRTDRPPGSVGEWLHIYVSRAAIASYLGAILVYEGHAEKLARGLIKFRQIPYAGIWSQYLGRAKDYMEYDQWIRFRSELIDNGAFNNWGTLDDVPEKWRELLLHLWYQLKKSEYWLEGRFEFLAPGGPER